MFERSPGKATVKLPPDTPFVAETTQRTLRLKGIVADEKEVVIPNGAGGVILTETEIFEVNVFRERPGHEAGVSVKVGNDSVLLNSQKNRTYTPGGAEVVFLK